jgi:hypothetical protein
MNPDTETIVRKPNKFHIMAISIGLLVALPLGSFLFFNSQSFFARASDELPRDVIVSDITKSSATIVWTTDKETQAVVEYGLSPEELTLFSPELSAKQDHSVDLTLLTPSTTYYFQIRLGGTVYDNAGVPWTFTTHSISGEDVRDRVKGVSTQITPRITKKPENSTDSASLNNKCTATDCDEVKGLLGKGCSARDYVQCLSGNKSSTSSAATITQAYVTPYPTPSSVLIISNLCKLDGNKLKAISGCSKWMWDSIDLKTQVCRDSFYQYNFQCKSSNFDTTNENDVWYYFGAIRAEPTSGVAPNTATLIVSPPAGSTVYCQVRAEDEVGGDGHATGWVRSEKKCD